MGKDPFQTHPEHWDSVGISNLHRANLSSYFEYLEVPSEVFIDFFYGIRILQNGGFIVLDDADLPSVLKVIEYAQNNLHNLQPFPPGCFDHTFTFRKISSQDPRPWYSHALF